MFDAKKISAPLSIILFSISALILLFTGLSVALIMIFKSIAENDIDDIVEKTAEAYVAGVDSKLYNYITGIDSVSLNKMLRDQMWNSAVTEMDMVTLGTQMQRNVDSITYSFYKSGDIYSHRIYSYLPTDGSYFFNMSRAEEFSWYKTMKETGIPLMRWYEYSNITKSNHLNIAKSISPYGIPRALAANGDCYQTISINLSRLLVPETDIFSDELTEIYLFDAKSDQMVYATNLDNSNDIADYYNQFAMGMGVESEPLKAYTTMNKDKNTNITVCNLSQLDLSIVLVFPRKSILENNKTPRNLIAWCFVVPVFFLLLFMLLFYKVYSKRQEYIIKNIDEFDEQSAVTPPLLNGNDELARIDRHVNRMITRTKVLFRENYLEKII